jgi:hypothetical protein
MTQAADATNSYGFDLPTAEQGLAAAKRRLAQTFRPTDMIWVVGEVYDPTTPARNIDFVRQGAIGRWVRQRARYDEQAEVLYYLGEIPLTDAEFRAVRQKYARFPIAALQA